MITFKKLTFLLLAFILCASFLNVQATAAAQNETRQTTLVIDHYWESPYLPFDPTVWLYTEAYLIETSTGHYINDQNLRYELYNPKGVLCEVKNQKTESSWFGDDVHADAYFEGPFTGGYWTLKVIYNGSEKNHLAPCDGAIRFMRENENWVWGGSD
jgi:hypothetical protein